MKLWNLEPARNDLIEGFEFYEGKEAGLGEYFLTSLFADIESLRFYAGIHRKACREFYRALSNRFPFAIYYTLEEEGVLIQAVIDCHRRPSWIRERLKKE